MPGFQAEIFISYTHADNVPVAGVCWVNEFHESLENWLCKRRGLSGLTLWRDPALDGNNVFDEAIENRIKSSALFIALHSRNYPKSECCRKELAAFYQHNRDRPAGLVVGERSRIFNVLLNNIPHPEWPPEFQGTSGFPIHDAASEADFGDFTFLVFPSDDPAQDPLIDIFHESLIRQWQRLNRWVDEEAESAEVYRRLADTARLHAEGKAGLYRDPDLQMALDWQDKQHPHEEWA